MLNKAVNKITDKLTDNEIKKTLERCIEESCYTAECRIFNETGDGDLCQRVAIKYALDLINRLQAENKDLFYKLEGVMHSVDKWLDGDELKQDEINRAITMREKTLKIAENLQAENERLNEHYNIALQTVGEFKEENSRLLHFNEELAMELDAKKIVTEAEIVRNAKSEAYKECIEKVKKLMEGWGDLEYHSDVIKAETDLDNLLKELKGDK